MEVRRGEIARLTMRIESFGSGRAAKRMVANRWMCVDGKEKRSRSEISNRRGVSKSFKKSKKSSYSGAVVFWWTLVAVRQRRHVERIGEERIPQAEHPCRSWVVGCGRQARKIQSGLNGKKQTEVRPCQIQKSRSETLTFFKGKRRNEW